MLSGLVPIIPLPQPAAAMLALDISGSMLARECATCPTRYDILKQAVEIFAQLWSQIGRPNDRLGVTYFRTTVDEPLINGDRLPMLAGNVASLVTHVNGQNVVPANLTAMGGGLQRSIEALRACQPKTRVRGTSFCFRTGCRTSTRWCCRRSTSRSTMSQVGRPPE